jgi:hypothetical protein
LLSTANELLDELDEPVDELDDPPLAPDAAPPAAAEELLEESSLVLASLLVPPPEAVSPTSPLSETIVPLSGASSRVSATACSSLLTDRRSLRTAAFAEAMFASRVAELMLVADEEDEPDEESPELTLLLACFFLACFCSDLLLCVGEASLLSVIGVSPAGEEPLVVVLVVGELVVEVLVLGVVALGAAALCVGVAAVCASAIDAAAAVAEPALDPLDDAEPLAPEPEDSPSVSSSRASSASADCRFALACSSATSALCGSSVASSCPCVTC